MKRRKIWISILLGLCACFMSATYFSACENLTHTHTYTSQTTNATCGEKGLITYTCDCGDTYTEEIPATDAHVWDEGKKTVSPSCTEEGETIYTCTVCKTATKTAPIEKLPHEYAAEWSYNETHHYHECKCGDKADEAAHVPSAPATEETAQTCTVCGYVIQDRLGIMFNTLTVADRKVYGKVDNAVTEFIFSDEITVNGKASYVVSADEDGTQTLENTISLEVGDNVVYVIESIDNEITKVYTVTIRRRPIYTVVFETDGGTAVESQTVEEDSLATEPETTKTGYTFLAWDYDFSTPITQDTKITASWKANEDTSYKVNYYLQNLENDEYTLTETDELTGTTDTTVTAEIKTFEHFTYNEGVGTVSGNVDSDGGQVLSVYYTRNTYTLSVNDSSIASITSEGTYKYGTELTSTVTNYLGYDFLGWYSGETLISTDTVYTFTLVQNVTAKVAVNVGMQYFTFTSTTTTCTITGITDKTLTEIVIPNCVTSIDNSAFSNCTKLRSVIIGNSVTSIGNSAFYWCSSLKEIVIPDSVTSIGNSAFYWCSSLKEIVIPDSVTSIGNSMFYGCNRLTEIVIPDSVTSIGNSAFESCSKLTNVTISSSVASIGKSAFEDCEGLTEIAIPNSLTSIGNDAFYNCSNLTGVYITDIEDWCNIAFDNFYSNPLCYANNLYLDKELVTKIVFPDTLLSIGDYAFSGCNSLLEVVIPESVKSIGSSAFYNCNSLADITLPFVGATKDGKSDTHFGYIFGASSSSKNDDYVPASLKSVTVTSVTSIGSYAFAGCSSLTGIVIPDDVTSIGNYAFYDCSSLTEIKIPDSVTSIASWTFYGCNSLKTITLPFVGASMSASNGYDQVLGYIFGYEVSADAIEGTTLQYIDTSKITYYRYYIPMSLRSITITGGEQISWAFYNCTYLTEIVLPDSVTQIDFYSFLNCDSLINITLPFVGHKKDGKNNTHLGYIFGASSYNENWDDVPASLRSVTITSATNIGDYAFSDCSSLTEIVLPDGVTSIGNYAFSRCSGLTEIVIPDSVTSIGDDAFKVCSSLTEIVIPDSVKSIGSSAFQACSSLTEIVIPGSVKSIGDSAFYGCSILTDITVNENNTAYKSVGGILYSKDGEKLIWYPCAKTATKFAIPDSVTSIGSSAFSGCSSLTEIVLPDSVTSIGWSAFSGCSSLTEIVLPDSVTSIGERAFYNCSSLTEIVLPDSVTSIGNYTFYNCSSLTEIVIPESVTSIGWYAFYNCSSLTEIVLPDSVTSIGSSAFFDCSSLTEIVIPDSVTSIGDSAFSGCSSLTEIVIPDNITSIDNYAFKNCSGLTEIVLPDSLTSIGSDAFYNCSSLTEIVIPDSVTSIGDDAFYNCSSLTIYCEAENQPEGWDSYWNLSNRPVYWYSENEPALNVDGTAYEGNYWKYDENGEIDIWTKETV
ncbi:MAG: leucine-rich repeat protein [Clostridia bacterium]|nr:leucine-rich repeat protein [Clostridia bacterium]